MTANPHPFELVFAALAEERFPAIRASAGSAPSLDAFLLDHAAVELLHELRPDAGIGDAIDDFVAFAHAAFRFWADGATTRRFDEPATRVLCESGGVTAHTAPVSTQYIQLSPRLIWAQLDAESPHEPLDGWFAIPDGDDIRIVACFGVHPERPGLSVVVVAGPCPGAIAREDGSRLFGPTMPGGDAAALHAIAAPEELLLLAWRVTQPQGGP